MPAGRRTAFRTGISAIVFGGAALLGCNALSGIGDYDFNGRSGSSSGTPEDMNPNPDSSAPVCPEGASVVSAVENSLCLPCLLEKCCDTMKACAADTPCNGERKCVDGCKGDALCIVNCRNTFACGLLTDLALNYCENTMCVAECTDPVASAPDSGDDGGACKPFAGACITTIPQCGCKAGENCVYAPGFGGDTSCVPAGTTLDDLACTKDADCLAGSFCEYGACKPFCDKDSKCPTTRSGCILGARESKECNSLLPIFGAGFCGTKCDPLNPSAVCGAGVSCEAFSTFTDCRGPTGAAIGPSNCGSGTAAEKCAPGYTCLTYPYTDRSNTTHEVNTCERWCAIGAGGCPGSTLCTPLTDAPKIGSTTYGTCSANCDLAKPSTCPTGSACFNFTDANKIQFTTCLPTTGTGVGTSACETTQTPHDCARGYACVHGANGSTTYDCLQWCRIGGTDCPGSETCQSITGAPTIRGTEYGHCG